MADLIVDQEETIESYRAQAKDIQESLLKAMDSLLKDRLDRYAIDQTVICTVVRCNNSLTGEYTVSYQGGNMTAYSDDSASYSQGTSVYVLVPLGDFSSKKIILGKAASIGNDDNITFVSSLVNDYNPQGRNVLDLIDPNNHTFGLHSYLKEDYCLIYDYEKRNDNPTDNYISINIDELNNYIANADAVMLEADFRTRLPNEHRNTKTGIYGLLFILAFHDRSTSDETVYKPLSYVIDTNNMTGNPYAYLTWSSQYAIYPIDTENFSHIQSIVFYSQAFEEEDDLIKDRLYGADIWCTNIEFQPLRKISAVNGDYRLRLNTPLGATFKESNPNDSLNVLAQVTYKNQPAEGWMFYWFKEDARVTTSSNNYKAYGGTGWASLEQEKGTTNKIVVYEKENKAYINKYLCVAVYQNTIVLKDQFIIYNDSSKRDLKIESNLGVKFSFDRGTPILTCFIDNKESDFDADNATNRPDDWFSFVWSKIDPNGQTDTFEKTYEELQEEYADAMDGDTELSVLEAMALRIKMQQMQGVTFDKNHLTYPIRSIETTANFKCSVYLKDKADDEPYFIGSTDIVLQNDGAATPEDYSIIIENGDQVFQYSESGVTPTSDRNLDPQEILPLTCHFYDPAGLEIEEDTYTVEWLVPIENTMIEPPEDELKLNPATGRIELYAERVYPMNIVKNFDYQALINQVTCIVTYNGQEYQKDTRFSFVKIGDNGTNGTDVVARITPLLQVSDDDLLTLFLYNGQAKWNTVTPNKDPITAKALEFELYQREQIILPDQNVTWSMAGGTSTVLEPNLYDGEADGKQGLRLKLSEQKRGKRLQIVKAQTTLERVSQSGTVTGDDEVSRNLRASRTTYYAFYPIPIISVIDSKGFDYPLHIDYDYTLKQIIYNSDGRNPLYNKNQGIKLRYGNHDNPANNGEIAKNRKIVFEALGGKNETAIGNANTAAFKLIQNRDDYKKPEMAVDTITLPFDENGECMVYILPEDVYNGLYTNNLVHGFVMNGNVSEAEFWIPIHMQLNTVELASLNAWDGNSIEINNDDNYILAPQIGAGEKDKENRFTGILMGKSQKYDNPDANIGILGYSHGKQSIWMDAETGNTILGLSDIDAESTNDPLIEGRIELIPGGISSIARWKIDRYSLYNVGADRSGKAGEIGKPYTGTNKAPDKAQRSIPHTNPGILLNADPTYASFKGRQLENRDFSSINQDSLNRIVYANNTLELQIDPNDMSIFTIYRHYISKSGSWEREPLVGIDAKGRFYANTIKTPVETDPNAGQTLTTAFTLGYLGAFGTGRSEEKRYLGAYLDTGDDTIFKIFVDSKHGTGPFSGENLSPVFLSGTDSGSTEYQRAMKLYGRNIEAYVSTSSSIQQTTDMFFRLNSNEAILQLKPGTTKDARALRIRSNDISELHVGNFTETVEGTFTKDITGTSTTTIGGDVTETYSKNHTWKIDQKQDVTIGSDATYTLNGNKTETVKRDVTETFNGKHTWTIDGAETITVKKDVTHTINGKLDKSVDGDVTYTHKGNEKHTISRELEILTGSTGTFKILTTGSTGQEGYMFIGSETAPKASLYLKKGVHSSEFKLESGLQVITGGDEGVPAHGIKDIGFKTNGGSIRLYARNATSDNDVALRLEPGATDSNHKWQIVSTQGSIQSAVHSINNIPSTTVQVNDTGIMAKWGYFPGDGQGNGTFPGDNNASIIAARDIKTTGGWFYGNQIVLNDLTNGGILDGNHPPIKDTNVVTWIRGHDKWAGGVEGRVRSVEGRVGSVEGRVGSVEGRVAALEQVIGRKADTSWVNEQLAGKANATHSHNYASSSHTHKYMGLELGSPIETSRYVTRDTGGPQG